MDTKNPGDSPRSSASDGNVTETFDVANLRTDSSPPEIEGFRVERRLGRGGMGHVWQAVQEGDVRRQVAIKIVRHDRRSENLERFRAEQAALARMSHPNVAAIHQIGTDQRQRPYIVMELIRGEPISRYASRRALSIDQRLSLFCQACNGVLHAHQSGLIHRDIKPSNVLVAEVDDEPIVKVIDFGIAKDLGGDLLDERKYETYAGQLIGTPAYMSPEQRLGETVDTRTDVYSLGALLFQMLFGEPPAPGLLSSSVEPSGNSSIRRPSDLIQTGSAGPGTQSGLDSSTLRRRLRGDLDVILLKALHANREERYPSVSELRNDVERYLRQEPVTAANPTLTDTLIKWSRRNRAATVVAVLSAFALTLATALVLRFALLAEDARQRAMEDARRARAVEDFLIDDVLAQNDNDFGLGPTSTILEVLARAESQVEGTFPEDAAVHASLRNVIGKMYRNLGERDTARRHLSAAWNLAREQLGPSHPTTLSSQVNLGFLERNSGDLERARQLLEGAYEESIREQGLVHGTSRGAASGLASVLRRQGQLEDATKVLGPVLEAYRLSDEREDHKYLVLLNDLALLQWRSGELAEAAENFEECLSLSATARTRPSNSDRSLMANLANVWADMGRFEESAQTYERLLDDEERVLGEHHGTFQVHLFNAGGIELDRGNYARAKELLGRLMLLLKEYDPLPRRLMNTGARLALAEYRLREFEAAEDLWLDAWAISESGEQRNHGFRASVAANLARLYEETQRSEVAESWRERAESETAAAER